MDKKLVLFSIFVSLFILGGLSFANAALTINKPTAGQVISGSFVFHVNETAGSGSQVNIHNITIYYNASGIPTLITRISNTSVNQKGYSATISTSTLTDGSSYTLTAAARTNRTGNLGSGVSNDTNLNVGLDNTRPTVSFVGNVTDGFVFYSRSHMQKGYPAQDRFLLVKVTDVHAANCTLWLSRPFAPDTILANRSTSTGPANTYNITTNSTGSSDLGAASSRGIFFFNVSFGAVSVFPNSKYTWGAACRDNATTMNVRVAAPVTANRTFYFDNRTPTFPSTFGMFFDDSDTNPKDTSKSGIFTIGGVWTSELLETITFTCDASDTAGSTSSTFYMKEPGSTEFRIVGTSTGKKFDFKDTKKSGVYETYCHAADIAGNTTQSSTFKFRLQAEDEGEEEGEPAYVKPFNVDFSKLDTKRLAEPEGRILTVSFDGRTEHTIEFQKVTSDSVTLVIKSTPQVITLKVGESRNIDVNDDGQNDFAVTLSGIVAGKASVDFKKLSGAEAVAREEGKVTTTVRSTAGEVMEKGRGTTAIWVVVLIVVVGVIIYLVVARRKKK